MVVLRGHTGIRARGSASRNRPWKGRADGKLKGLCYRGLRWAGREGVRLAGFFARRKFRNEVIAKVNAMLLFYPGGVKNLARNYPNLGSAIDGNFDAGGISHGRSALLIAGSVISNEFEHLDPNDRDAIRRQLGKIDFEQFKQTLRGKGQAPQDIMGGTSLAALALVMAEIELKNGEVTEDDFKNFASEISGALQGKNFSERSYERTRDTIVEVLGPPQLP